MIKIGVVTIVFYWVLVVVAAFLALVFYLPENKKKIVRIVESIGYIALFISVGWNIIFEISRGTIESGQYITLKEQLQAIWIFLGHLSNHQDANLANQYNSLNLHLINLSNGESDVREQHDIAKRIQWGLTFIATSFTAVGKLYDVANKNKEEKVLLSPKDKKRRRPYNAKIIAFNHHKRLRKSSARGNND